METHRQYGIDFHRSTAMLLVSHFWHVWSRGCSMEASWARFATLIKGGTMGTTANAFQKHTADAERILLSLCHFNVTGD